MHMARESEREKLCKMESVLSLSAVIGPDVNQQITWLQSKGLLPQTKHCPSCSTAMSLQARSDITDKFRWRCPDSTGWRCPDSTGVHTQNVESYWNRVKGKFKRMKGVHESMLNSYLDEFMWRERHGRSAVTALASLCRDISLKYPQ